MDFWECGIAGKVSKVIFENTYLWVTFGKSLIFSIFMFKYLFLILKSTPQRIKICYINVLAYFSNARFDFLVKLS